MNPFAARRAVNGRKVPYPTWFLPNPERAAMCSHPRPHTPRSAEPRHMPYRTVLVLPKKKDHRKPRQAASQDEEKIQ